MTITVGSNPGNINRNISSYDKSLTKSPFQLGSSALNPYRMALSGLILGKVLFIIVGAFQHCTKWGECSGLAPGEPLVGLTLPTPRADSVEFGKSGALESTSWGEFCPPAGRFANIGASR